MATFIYGDMDENEREEFIDGWRNAGGIMSDWTSDNPAPWCCPWEYMPNGSIEAGDAYIAGMIVAHAMREQYEEYEDSEDSEN